MLDIERYTIKAGAYVLYNGYFLFMVGFGAGHENNVLGVVRFGGHREVGESAAECAAREIKEEASLDIKFYDNHITYAIEDNLEITPKITCDEKQNPILIRTGKAGELSIMYLAYGFGDLNPDMETQGILLLRKEDIESICSGRVLLREYKENGGKVILAKPLPDGAVLSPNIQLRFLNKLFAVEPELMNDYMNVSPILK